LGVFDEALPAERVIDRALDVAREMAVLPADVYARTKHELRRAALSAMTEAAEADPLLEVWTS
jgi:enoyl-CoA hydratase/carnithine racemase